MYALCPISSPSRIRADPRYDAVPRFCVLEIWENEPGKGKDLVDALFNQFKTNAKYRVSRTQTALLACTSVHLCRLEPAAGHDHRCVQDAP